MYFMFNHKKLFFLLLRVLDVETRKKLKPQKDHLIISLFYSIVYYTNTYNMVRNQFGGNKAKAFARKDLSRRKDHFRMAVDEGEIYAQAVKVLGGNMASAIDVNGNPLRVHIRGKFRGKGKRDNFIGPNVWLLVGLHGWEGEKKTSSGGADIRNCDVLEVYNESDKQKLKTMVTDVNWSKFIANDASSTGKEPTDDDGVGFMDESAMDYERLMEEQMTLLQEKNTKKVNVAPPTLTIALDEGDEICVDDI